MPMFAVLTAGAALSAALCIGAKYRRNRALLYVTKPLATALVIAIAAAVPAPAAEAYRQLLVAGLLFSLVGDVFLMLPHRFVAGLASFLVAHLFFTAAFVSGGGWRFTWWVLAAIATPAAIVVMALWPHAGKLRVPVVLYVAGIVTMAWQASERALALGSHSSAVAACGAILFLISDAALALNKFRRSFRSAELIVLTTYYVAIWCFAASVALTG